MWASSCVYVWHTTLGRKDGPRFEAYRFTNALGCVSVSGLGVRVQVSQDADADECSLFLRMQMSSLQTHFDSGQAPDDRLFGTHLASLESALNAKQSRCQCHFQKASASLWQETYDIFYISTFYISIFYMYLIIDCLAIFVDVRTSSA